MIPLHIEEYEIEYTVEDTAEDTAEEIIIPPVIDLTEKKTFILATFLSLLFGLMIGIGFSMIFEQFPLVSHVHRIEILLICLLTGCSIGYLPHLLQLWYYEYTNKESAEDSDKFVEDSDELS